MTPYEAMRNWMMSPFFGYTPSVSESILGLGSVAPVDVCERDNEYIVRMACPGCRPEDIDVTVENDVVRIRGTFPSFESTTQGQAQTPSQTSSQTPSQTSPQGQWQGQTQGRTGETCLIQELPRGRFEREIQLPTDVDSSKSSARFENGLLTLSLPKSMAAQGRKIQIGTGAGTGTGTSGATSSLGQGSR